MNNLKPLVWVEQPESFTDGRMVLLAQGAGITYRMMQAQHNIAITWHNQIKGTTGANDSYKSFNDAQAFVSNTHYPHFMSEFVKPMPTWIDASERLPEKHTTVLVVYHAHFDDEPITEFDVCTAFFDGETFDPKDQLFYMKRNTTVTQWMPIPEFSTMQNLHRGE